MSLTSYAQNFEDVMLWRALGHVEAGAYVDVGAQHPVIDSVSKAFYEHGWRGTHIEPVPEFADLLRRDRPDETVLQVALGATEGTLELYVIADTGLSTAVAAHAQRHHDRLGMQVRRIEVPVLTLTSALKALAGTEVHWLKIDVEGFEEQVLQGWDSRLLRPWVMVVEATVPGSPDVHCQVWDPILVAANYRFVYFDGLNRFYIAAEHSELEAAFSCPPNVFDRVELSGLATSTLCRGIAEKYRAELAALSAELEILMPQLLQANARLAAKQSECNLATTRVAELHSATDEWRSVADGLNDTLLALRGSNSWRLTSPLRKARRTMRIARQVPPRVARRAVRSLRLGAKSALVWTMRKALARPGLTALALRFLHRHPALRRSVHNLAARTGLIQQHSAQSPPARLPAMSPDQLAPRAARIYAELEKAVEESKD
ncbi:MAG: FkbM family methyltransferase [Massilia sp.]|nr:FkbM family methyltransferase [Massilia sp.]